MQNMLVTPARQLLHQPVCNLQDAPLGEIEELVIDLDRGYIVYAVLAHRTTPDTTRKRFVIPWSAFSVDSTNGQLRLNLQPEVLRDAKGLDYDAPSPAPLSPSLASA